MTTLRSYFGGMTLLLTVLASLFGISLFHQWNTAMDHVAPAETHQVKDRIVGDSLVQPFRVLPLTSFTEITQRPLFVEGRVPPEEPDDPAAVTVSNSPLKLKLEGVAITPDSKTAVITDLATGELLRLREGMSHKDWQVLSVEREAVVIKHGKQELELTLEIDADMASGSISPTLPFKRSPVRNRPFAVPNQ